MDPLKKKKEKDASSVGVARQVVVAHVACTSVRKKHRVSRKTRCFCSSDRARIIIKPGGWHDHGGGGGPFIERNALTVDSILTGQTCVSILRVIN